MQTVGFFDTETTGLIDFGSELHEPHQPRIVQLAWKIYHDQSCVLSKSSLISGDYESHPAALSIHRKTLELRNRYGYPINNVLPSFFKDMAKCDLVVAHNIDFDDKMVRREGVIAYVGDESDNPFIRFLQQDRYCTMKNSTNICKIPGKRGFKWPTLDEAYRALVDPAGFPDAHDAMVDVEACAKVYFVLTKEKP